MLRPITRANLGFNITRKLKILKPNPPLQEYVMEVHVYQMKSRIFQIGTWEGVGLLSCSKYALHLSGSEVTLPGMTCKLGTSICNIYVHTYI